MMSEDLKFFYREEFWFMSAFINTHEVVGEDKAEEMEAKLLEKAKNLTENDFPRLLKRVGFDAVQKVIDMGKNMIVECDWVPYFEAFPYVDEDRELSYNTLGYFRFEVEYYPGEPAKKATITPDLIQQIPGILKWGLLPNYSEKIENKYILLDLESPIFVFVTSNQCNPNIQWTNENIEKYKKVLGQWIEVYSGQWPDYNEALYDRRIENNLSNRLSELHFIRRNSGFIYMAEENYEDFFSSYMKQWVLAPTPQVRSVLFALLKINEALDLLFVKRYSESFMSLEVVEEKIKNLRYLRGMIQTKMSLIWQELDLNRRQHYTSVLKHLVDEFNLYVILKRINDKFKITNDSMQELYLKKNEENQKRAEKGLNFLNLLFGVGVLADLGGVIMVAMALPGGDLFSMGLFTIIAIVMSGILGATIFFVIKAKLAAKSTEEGRTVDAVILDGNGNIIIIKRKYPPYKGQLALPGGFIGFDENEQQALIREVREETGLSVKIEDKIGVYDQVGRDPRGKVISTAFKCSLISDISKIKAGDDAFDVQIVPIKELKGKDLAFDHEVILKDADLF